jgi:hypothetical protein
MARKCPFLKIRQERGQATTEVVLLFPVFLMFLLIFAKLFALLILVQKIEIASFYAARRWQLESHRNASFESFDSGPLQIDIADKTCSYLGYAGGSGYDCNAPTSDTSFTWGGGKTSSSSNGNFLGLITQCVPSSTCPNSTTPGVQVQRTQVWNVVTVTACTKSYDIPFMPGQTMGGYVFCSTKYVPNRDRPIAFVLPGLNPGGP